MKKFNLNAYVYIQIPKQGWSHLSRTRTPAFIEACLKPYKKTIDGEEWYKIQMHEVFRLFPVTDSMSLIETTVMFDDDDLMHVE